MLRGWLSLPPGPGPHAGGRPDRRVRQRQGATGRPRLPPRLLRRRVRRARLRPPQLRDSDGSPRQELDPLAQSGVTAMPSPFLSQVPDVDPDAIGIWGTSYSGGVVLGVAAVDGRVKCVVSQVPTISGGRALSP